jgi:hypothetical protein
VGKIYLRSTPHERDSSATPRLMETSSTTPILLHKSLHDGNALPAVFVIESLESVCGQEVA